MIEHKEYGRALIHWKDWHDPKNRIAMTVTYDPLLQLLSRWPAGVIYFGAMRINSSMPVSPSILEIPA